MNYCLHSPTVVGLHTSPAGVYHHFIFTYFRVLQVKLSCRLAVSRAQDEWRASNLLQDFKYYSVGPTSVMICNVHGQVMGIFAWHAPLNTLTGHSRMIINI